MEEHNLTLAGNSSPTRTQGTGPRPSVNEKVKPIRQTSGSQDPAEVTITDSGSCSFKKKTVPNKPMKREHNPDERSRRGRLPDMFSTRVPRNVPTT